MSAHTTEPWQLNASIEDADDCLIESADGRMIAEFFEDGEPHTDEDRGNARRTLACVNACAGLPTEELEHVRQIDIASMRRQIREQRDELAGALRAVLNRYRRIALDPSGMLSDLDSGPIGQADAALAKVVA